MNSTAPTRPMGPVIGQLYVTCAVLSLVAIFVPLYLPTKDRTSAVTYSLWRGITEFGEGIAVVAVLLILVTAGLLLAAAQRLDQLIRPLLVLVASILGGLMVVLSPAQPQNTVFGTGLGILLATALIAAVTSVVHFIKVTSRPR